MTTTTSTLHEQLLSLTNRQLDQWFRMECLCRYQDRKATNVEMVLRAIRMGRISQDEVERHIEAIKHPAPDPNNRQLPVGHPDVKALLKATFPDYRGRKVRLRQSDTYHLANYWDGGTRRSVVAYDLATGRTSAPDAATGNPFTGAAHATVEIPDGVALVEHTSFQHV